MTLRFAKLHGLGNSYIFIDLVRQEAPDVDWPELARRISDPAFGVGSDGLILILPPTRSGLADLRMRMFNADGSESEMCGNGIRCLARYAADTGLICGDRLSVETAAGVLNLELFRRNGNVAAVRVDMGEPRLKRSDIPMACPSDDSPGDGGDPAERRERLRRGAARHQRAAAGRRTGVQRDGPFHGQSPLRRARGRR